MIYRVVSRPYLVPRSRPHLTHCRVNGRPHSLVRPFHFRTMTRNPHRGHLTPNTHSDSMNVHERAKVFRSIP